MKRITIPIKCNSDAHNFLTRGVAKHGQDGYRQKWKGEFYKVVDAYPAERGYFSLVLEALI